MLRLFWAASVVLTISWIGSASAQAAPAVISVQTPSVTLALADTGDGTGTLTTTNLTDKPVTLAIAVKSPPQGCTISPTQDAVPAAQQHDTKLTLTGCNLTAGGAIGIEVTPAAGQRLTVQGKVEAKPSPDWSIMSDSFGWATLASALVCALALWFAPKGPRGTRYRWALPGLGNDYDFSKSWATTATLVTSAFAGVFGSTDILKDVLGTEDASLNALVGVSAAIALGLVAAGPLAVGALKIFSKGEVTTAGLLGGAFLTLAGTGGQFFVLVRVGRNLDLGSFLGMHTTTVVLWLGIAGGALLALYAWQSLRLAMKEGAVAPKKASTTVRPKTRHVRDTVANDVELAIPKNDTEALRRAVDRLREPDGDEYEIEATGPVRTRTAIL